MHGGLARRVGGHAARRHHPGDGAEVDDGATAQSLHLLDHGLGGEELMAEVDGDALIPVLDGDALDRVAIVAGGVVHEDADVAELRLHGADGGPQGVDVADIAAEESWRRPHALEISNQPGAGGLVDVHEAHEGLLAHESGHSSGPDPRAAARDEHDLVLEAGIDGKTRCHGGSPWARVSARWRDGLSWPSPAQMARRKEASRV